MNTNKENDQLCSVIKLLDLETIINMSQPLPLLIPREQLLEDTVYEKIKVKIPRLKQFFSSSYMTALQSTADTQQRWPLLNLVRQILSAHHYKLVPKRLCDGYSSDGKKKYKRMFSIEKMLTTNID